MHLDLHECQCGKYSFVSFRVLDLRACMIRVPSTLRAPKCLKSTRLRSPGDIAYDCLMYESTHFKAKV